MKPLRVPHVFPWWAGALFALVGVGVPLTLILLRHSSTAGWVLVVWGVVFVTTAGLEPVLMRRRSRALRARLTPADVAARVDLAAVAGVLTSGAPRADLAGVRLVQRAFPHLMPADAVEVTRTAVPGLLPPRRSPERRPVP